MRDVRRARRPFGPGLAGTGLALALLGAESGPAVAQERAPASAAWLTPAPQIVDILDARRTPDVLVGPNRDVVALIERRSMPGIAELARPMHRLAGYRIDPRNSAPWRSPGIAAITVQPLDPEAEPARVVAPWRTTLGWPRFAPDGRHLSYAVLRDTGVEQWVVEVATGTPRPLTSASLNATWGEPCTWLADSSGVLCRFRRSARGAPPEPPRTPDGPLVRESGGRPAPVRTYQDLLRDPYDDALFTYHFTSQIGTVALATGRRTDIGRPGLFARVAAAPDGRHLLVERVEAPYPRSVPASRFARSIQVWTPDGDAIEIARRDIADTVPIGGVPTGPREHRWNAVQPATVVWIEAQDGGDPQREAAQRDRVLSLEAPFDGAPDELLRTEHRVTGVAWTEDGTALVDTADRATRWRRTWLLRAGAGDPRLVFDRSAEDAYADPGTPLRRPGRGTAGPILQDGDHIYLTGRGASPEGDHPFLDRFDIFTLDRERLFASPAGRYERAMAVLASDGGTLLTRRESRSEPPNYFVRDVAAGTERALTRYADPAPLLRQVRRQRLTYTRADGVALSATLYLPPDYRDGERRPLLLWAYPREYTSAAAAGQVRGSSERFLDVRGASHLLLLAEGYAILDGPAMPIVGGGETANDTYVEQLVASAAAAIDAVVDLGVADRERIAVGGHSYGALMTANLLAHSDLFQAGIARSGAYNRTLTPFGFQNERRTFWEAPDVYGAMSPFFHAPAIDEPLLLTHGAIDDNSGTFPLQSERLFAALAGHGATVRYVTLPHESHGYVARESVLHVVAEMLRWCDLHLGRGGATEARVSPVDRR
ncbi:MAG: prolyl oligopeptidase family serine peptidase [Acidobacteria bacterium]|nr:prolyl oligopeptidase family serine peptidase [Acidobacteriota bacterium]